MRLANDSPRKVREVFGAFTDPEEYTFDKTVVPLRLAAILSNILFISFGYLAHIHPVLLLHTALLPINIIEEIARPVVLAMRLAFNILAGDLLLFVVATIIAANVTIGPLHLSIPAAVVPFGVEFFNFFIGTIQAFVFTLLTIVYLSLGTAEEH